VRAGMPKGLGDTLILRARTFTSRGCNWEAAITRAIQILAFAAFALVVGPYDFALAGQAKSVSTTCKKSLLAVGNCQVVRCVGSNCTSVVLTRATARKARISLNQCIGAHDACVSNCFLSVQRKPPLPLLFQELHERMRC
jgi:hypothetical protein